MDIIITIIYIVLFLIMMIFVFSIGMLRPFMPKKEIALVLVVAFFIGALGGAFFLSPIYSDIPEIASSFEKAMPGNEETLYLDVSSSTDINKLESDLSQIEGFKSFEETGITIPLWKFSDREYEYFNYAVGNVDSHFTNYTVNKTDGTIYIALDNYSSSEALKSFADWYKLVFGGPISYAQVHAKVVISSSALDQVEEYLLSKGIVASSIDGSVQSSLDNTNASMISNTEFVLVCGGIGVVVGILGLFFDSFVVGKRRFDRFMRTKKKR
ncbi:MAG: hypothetical protein IJQ68_04630 [Methanobrevibacter sp.]|uniref:hypothetical protein n=1 Tax=Methanobrevibacter sp. TaxID=66852 RepID=UPI0025F51309|nr:hypothetical protein [Methanobrevibacter sp.]MBR0271263.1 hypothetical protein [Methanobrevibacter sp.]